MKTLNENRKRKSTEEIIYEDSDQPSSSDQEILPIKYNIENIFGREEDVNKILLMLEKNKSVSVCGPAGIGKTSLVYLCAQRWSDKSTQNQKHDIAFLYTETINDFERSIREFAEKISVDNYNSLNQIISDTYEYYNKNKNRNLLIIYDNLEDFSILEKYLPTTITNIYLLATTQNKEISNFFTIYSLQEISDESRIKLLKYLLPKEDLKYLKEILHIVSGFPMNLCQAAAYIKNMQDNDPKYTIPNYILEYNELFKQNNSYIALKINIDKIKPNKCYSLLQCFSYWNPSDISTEYFDVFNNKLIECGQPKDIKEMEMALLELQKYKLITLEGNRVKIHRLIQKYCRDTATKQEITNCFIILISCAFIKNPYKSLTDYIYFLNNLLEESNMESLQRVFSKVINIVDELNKNFMSSFKCLHMTVLDRFNALHYLFHLQLQTKDLETFLPFFVKNTYTAEIWKPIHSAAMSDEYDPMELLIKYIPDTINDINAKTYHGYTPLHISAALTRCSTIRFLIENNCEINIKDNKGCTALDLAVQNNHVYAVQLLVNKTIYSQTCNDNELKNIINHLNDKEFKLCNNVIKSPKNDVIRKIIIIWLCYHPELEEAEDLVECMMKDSGWWNEQSSQVKEFIELLGYGRYILYSACEYMENLNISINDLLEILRKDDSHEVLQVFCQDSLNPAGKYVYKMICLVIDYERKRCLNTYNMLTVMSYCEHDIKDLNRYALYNSLSENDVNSCYDYLQKYKVDGLIDIFAAVVRTYVQCNNQTRNVIQQVLFINDKSQNCNNLNDINYTDEQINSYLKSFYPNYE